MLYPRNQAIALKMFTLLEKSTKRKDFFLPFFLPLQGKKSLCLSTDITSNDFPLALIVTTQAFTSRIIPTFSSPNLLPNFHK